MRTMKLSRAFTLIEPGPVVLVTTHDGTGSNIMTISWTMVLDFTPRFALMTGSWNHSFEALHATRECVLAIPTVDLIDEVVGIGTCSGNDVVKFAAFKLTAGKGKHVKAPLIEECWANIECKVQTTSPLTAFSCWMPSPPIPILPARRGGPFTPSATERSSSTVAIWTGARRWPPSCRPDFDAH